MANEAGAQSESSDLALPVISIWEQDGKYECDLGGVSLAQAQIMVEATLHVLGKCRTKVNVRRGRKLLRTQEWTVQDDET